MADKVKSFGAGAIIMSLIMTLFAGMLTWVGVQASEVPKIQTTLKIEVGHLNSTLKDLTTVMKETISSNRDTVNRLNDSIVATNYEIITIKARVDENRRDIQKMK